MIPDYTEAFEQLCDEFGDVACLVWLAAFTSVVLRSLRGGDKDDS